MKTIRVSLEYRCFPIWVYGETGELLENDLVDELKDNQDIDRTLTEIQEIYDGLFEDSPTHFEYKGFANDSERNNFLKKIEVAMKLIGNEVGGNYIIKNEVTVG